jgi:hypothetical protein
VGGSSIAEATTKQQQHVLAWPAPPPNTPDSQSGSPCVRKHFLLLSYLSQQKITPLSEVEIGQQVSQLT